MKPLIWILTGVGFGFIVSKLLNEPSSQLAYDNSGVEDAATRTSLWGTKQRIGGTGGSLLGKAKEGLGNVVGDDELAGEGLLDQAVGTVKDTAGRAAHAVSDTLHDLNR